MLYEVITSRADAARNGPDVREGGPEPLERLAGRKVLGSRQAGRRAEGHELDEPQLASYNFV